jgi:hypothetical protein
MFVAIISTIDPDPIDVDISPRLKYYCIFLSQGDAPINTTIPNLVKPLKLFEISLRLQNSFIIRIVRFLNLWRLLRLHGIHYFEN